MGFNIGSIGKIFNTVTSSLSSLSTNIGSLLGKTTNGNEARTAPFTQPFSNNGQNDLTLRNLALNFNPTRATGQDKKLQTYRVEIPLAKGSQKASYEELSRRTMRTALEVNGIKPTNRELEEMMGTLKKRPIDFDIRSDDPTTFRATMATPKHIGTMTNGEKVMGYSFEMDDKFQRTVIKDYKAAQAALAGKSGEKAVVDMNLTERMGEAIKIAYEKGHISKEVREQLGNLTPTELTIAFGMGGAASLAAKTGARAILAPAGAALLGMEMIKSGAELEVFGKACAKATSRADLEKPAAEFGKWMGGLAKNGVLATAAGAGAKIAPGVMPKATAAAEGFFTTSVKGAKEAMRSTKGALAPELVTPEGVTVRTPTTQGKTPLEKIHEPLEVTKAEFDVLRRQSPTKKIQEAVNPDGPKVDPVYGYPVERFEADHIVSLKRITEMDGFDELTKAQQVEVINMRDNFLGLGKSTNASKGAKSWADWEGHSKLGPVPPEVKERMIQIENEARDLVQKAIQERVEINQRAQK